jgi:hypothetical protein
MPKSGVPELPKNGTFMHFPTSTPVEMKVGISLRAKFFHTVLWKSLAGHEWTLEVSNTFRSAPENAGLLR